MMRNNVEKQGPRLFDINEAEWKDWENGLISCVFKATDKATLQYWILDPGCGAVPHSHPAEQLTYVQQGYMELTVDGRTYDMSPGCFCLIPSGAEHCTQNKGTAPCVNIDIFLPERDDREQSGRIADLGHNWEA